MLLTLATAFAGLAAALPQTSPVAPPAPYISSSFDGTFELTVVTFAQNEAVGSGPTDVRPRGVCSTDLTLVLTLSNGILKDGLGRTGYIASNSQLQFNEPPQENSLAVSGFSIFPNSSLALTSSALWYQCLSGTFYNLYSTDWAPQCDPILLDALPCDSNVHFPEPATVGFTAVVTTVQTIVSGGITTTIQTAVPIPLCQIDDGQVQAHLTPCAGIELPVITISPSSPAPPASPGLPSLPLTPIASSIPPPTESTTPPPGATTASSPPPAVPASTTTPPFSVTTTTHPTTAPTAGAVTFVPGSLFALAMGATVMMLCL